MKGRRSSPSAATRARAVLRHRVEFDSVNAIDASAQRYAHASEGTIPSCWKRHGAAAPVAPGRSRSAGVLHASERRGISVNVLEDESIREGVKLYSKAPTIPELYVGGEFIGAGGDIARRAAGAERRTWLGQHLEAFERRRWRETTSRGRPRQTAYYIPTPVTGEAARAAFSSAEDRFLQFALRERRGAAQETRGHRNPITQLGNDRLHVSPARAARA